MHPNTRVKVFYLCQKAVTHPIAPLFDPKESDQDGYLNDQEFDNFQRKCFDKLLPESDLSRNKQAIQKLSAESITEKGIDVRGFILWNKMYAEGGRHEIIWTILRAFHYTDSLSLKDSFVNPKFEVPPYSSAELSPAGYRFFVDLFLLFDKDNDGGLNDQELAALFAPSPGLPSSWADYSFPSSTFRNEAGHITLQGWLAQWSMTTFVEPKTTLEYLAYLGFESLEKGGTMAALKVTKPRRRRRRPGRVDRNVVSCYVLGASQSGKSSLLDAFLNRPFCQTYHPTIKPRTAVNNVELQGGKQCYLIVRFIVAQTTGDFLADEIGRQLEELGELEPAILENQVKLDTCDILCYTYDSSDPDSFSHIVELRVSLTAA
ncbi:ERMES complex Ca(2+)-binding regulatory GTPase gem1 [Trichoglossum hirsutum]|uniref:ERMES complex Ca(2+)-binding regulatory GTPase gem1 n=1 Tax=Trichoglossum hirsutum TaxID=265104 RepID=A0A9P8IDW3_9PEZI|nr:ERMES complex Ca(2+)-binding regulatory GTPase gem1 [Trichoglossum hirsutum]